MPTVPTIGVSRLSNTADVDGNVVYPGPAESAHTHPKNHNECTAEEVKTRIKRKATEHPEKLLLRK